MDSFNPSLNIAAITRKQKGLIKLYGGLAVPFYWTDVIVGEGTPMKFDYTTQDHMIPIGDGDASTLAVGLALQATYDDSAYGELRNYHFANSTKARLSNPIGLLTGKGYALTNLYEGTVAWGSPCYWDNANSKLSPTPINVGTGNATTAPLNKLPITFEGAGVAGAGYVTNNGTVSGSVMVRIRFNFTF